MGGEMMVTVVIHQNAAQKREEHVVSVAFSDILISNCQIFGRPGSLQRPRTS
jgi:hypothetical protein